MATMAITQTETDPVIEQLPLSIPLNTYAVNHDRAERAEPSPPMQPSSGVRNRGVGGRSGKNEETTSESKPSIQQSNSDPAEAPEHEGGMYQVKQVHPGLLSIQMNLLKQKTRFQSRLSQACGKACLMCFFMENSPAGLERKCYNIISVMDIAN